MHSQIGQFSTQLDGYIYMSPTSINKQYLEDPHVYVEETLTTLKVSDTLSLTLVHHNEVEGGTVVPALLFGVASKTSVVASVLKGDVPQQDGDVVVIVFPHKLHSFSIYSHMWHHPL